MTRVKICGLTTLATMSAAVEHGADYVGLVFFARSPRNVDVETAAALADVARGRSAVVGLTVDADDMTLAGMIGQVHPDMLQLHGSESAARVAEIKARFKLPIIKAISVATAADAASGADYEGLADLILFDAKAPKDAPLPGGNGLAFDWSVLSAGQREGDFMLSGGLNSHNVGDAIARTMPYAVDVSSGVESSPGVKDIELIRRFLRAVKTAKH